MNTPPNYLSPAQYAAGSRAIFKQNEYIIVPPDNRCSNPHLNLKQADEQILVTPKQGAGYQMSVFLFQPGGSTISPMQSPLETFYYLVEGHLVVRLNGDSFQLTEGGFGWLPPEQPINLLAQGTRVSRLLWFQRPYQPLPGVEIPKAFLGREQDVPAIPEVDINPERQLIPYGNIGFDMAFNLIEIPPGSFYGLVEQHAWEHAMYMLDGEGFLGLNGSSYQVKTDDFIFIAPYIPEWFCAYGLQNKPVRFLLYWDCNRNYHQYFQPMPK
jgi:(S)-ureidoglycine aminohydrolase